MQVWCTGPPVQCLLEIGIGPAYLWDEVARSFPWIAHCDRPSWAAWCGLRRFSLIGKHRMSLPIVSGLRGGPGKRTTRSSPAISTASSTSSSSAAIPYTNADRMNRGRLQHQPKGTGDEPSGSRARHFGGSSSVMRVVLDWRRLLQRGMGIPPCLAL